MMPNINKVKRKRTTFQKVSHKQGETLLSCGLGLNASFLKGPRKVDIIGFKIIRDPKSQRGFYSVLTKAKRQRGLTSECNNCENVNQFIIISVLKSQK